MSSHRFPAPASRFPPPGKVWLRQIIFFCGGKGKCLHLPKCRVCISESVSGGQQEGERSARRNLTIFWMQAFHLSLQGPRLFTWRTLFRRLIRWLTSCPEYIISCKLYENFRNWELLEKNSREFSAFSASFMLHLDIHKVQVYFSSPSMIPAPWLDWWASGRMGVKLGVS